MSRGRGRILPKEESPVVKVVRRPVAYHVTLREPAEPDPGAAAAVLAWLARLG